jgi:hypothetical protein
MPLLAVIVGSQQKTSSATIYKLPPLLPQNIRSPVHLGRQPYPSNCRKCLYIDDAGEGGLHVSDKLHSFASPLPLHPIPQTADIHKLVEVNGCGNNFLKISRRESL